jgi:hypothetical protein
MSKDRAVFGVESEQLADQSYRIRDAMANSSVVKFSPGLGQQHGRRKTMEKEKGQATRQFTRPTPFGRTIMPTILQRSLFGTFSAVATVVAGLSATPADAGTDQLWYTGYFAQDMYNDYGPSILNMKDGFCLDAQNASAGSGTIIQEWPCNAQWNQRWKFTNGLCNSSINYHGVIYQPICGASLWWSISVGDNSPDTGLTTCIDVPAGIDSQGQHLQLYSCNGTPAQVWRTGVADWGESPFWVRSNITGQGINRCWTNRNGQGQPVRIWDCAYDF